MDKDEKINLLLAPVFYDQDVHTIDTKQLEALYDIRNLVFNLLLDSLTKFSEVFANLEIIEENGQRFARVSESDIKHIISEIDGFISKVSK